MNDEAETAQIEQAASLLNILSGRTRLMILHRLWDGEKSVGELSRMIGARAPATSQQLGLLFDHGIVSRRREGQTIFYSIASEDARRVLEALGGVFATAQSEGKD